MMYRTKTLLATGMLTFGLTIAGCAESDNPTVTQRAEQAAEQAEEQLDQARQAMQEYVESTEDRIAMLEGELGEINFES